MAWPTDDLTNTHLDDAADDPSQGRAEINASVLKLKAVIAGADSNNVASQVVRRDAAGNFIAGQITAAFVGPLTGNVDGNITGTAAVATNALQLTGGIVGNSGVDATLETWSASSVAFQVGFSGSVVGNTTDKNTMVLMCNTYYNVVGNITYQHADKASMYSMGSGGHTFYVSNDTGVADATYAPVTAMRIDNTGYTEWGTFHSSGATSGRQHLTNGFSQTSVQSTGVNYHHKFYNPNGEVGGISTTDSATTYSTLSDPRLKSKFQDVKDKDLIKIIQDFAGCVGKFHFLTDKTKTKLIGFNAHKVLDLEMGSDTASHGNGPMDAKLGSEYDTGEVDDKDEAVMAPVTPAGVDQSKVTPALVLAVDMLIRKADKYDNLCKLLVKKKLVTKKELESL